MRTAHLLPPALRKYDESQELASSILRTPLYKLPIDLCHRYAKRLTTKAQKVSTSMKILLDSFPRINWSCRAVWQDQQLRIRQSGRHFERREIDEHGIHALESLRERSMVDRLTGDGGKAWLRENDYPGK